MSYEIVRMSNNEMQRWRKKERQVLSMQIFTSVMIMIKMTTLTYKKPKEIVLSYSLYYCYIFQICMSVYCRSSLFIYLTRAAAVAITHSAAYLIIDHPTSSIPQKNIKKHQTLFILVQLILLFWTAYLRSKKIYSIQTTYTILLQ